MYLYSKIVIQFRLQDFHYIDDAFKNYWIKWRKSYHTQDEKLIYETFPKNLIFLSTLFWRGISSPS